MRLFLRSSAPADSRVTRCRRFLWHFAAGGLVARRGTGRATTANQQFGVLVGQAFSLPGLLPLAASGFALCLVTALAAQSVDPWNDLRAKNPSEMEFHLRLSAAREYRQAELIRIELTMPAFAPGQVAPGELWQSAGFLLDPPVDCGSLAKPCVERAPPMGGLRAGRAPGEPEILALNSYLPPLRPGTYRAALLARKQMLANRTPSSSTYRYAEPAQYAVSEAVEFRVVAATAEWVRQTIAQSVVTINGGQASHQAYQAQTEAAQQLGFLDDPVAWAASLDLLPMQESTLLRGLSTTYVPAKVCELMQARVPVPVQTVSSSYLYTMTELCAKANLPAPPRTSPVTPQVLSAEIRLSPTPPPALPVAQPNPELQAWAARQRTYTQGLMMSATAALAGSLAKKQSAAVPEAFVTLFQHVQQTRANRPPEPDPAWLPVVSQEFVRAYPGLEVARKQYLLEMYTRVVDSPGLVPLLESVLDGWKPGDYYEAAHSALRGIYRVDPARAQARILAELTKPQTWLDTASLELLPASAVPPMDDALIEALASAQRSGGWNPQLRMAAIARYATPRALTRIKAIFESQQQPCQPELMAYFVRVDPAYADRTFHSHPWDMHTAPPRCTLEYFQRTSPWAMNSALEQYLAAYLMHSDVHVKTTAAHVLGRYGSGAALPKLWDTFRYFHEYWKGKGAELEKNGEGIQLEMELRDAIARGRGWLVAETDLRLIESLCSSTRCLSATEEDLRAWDRPLRIEIGDPAYGIGGKIAQYYGIQSVAAIEARLAQFPRGTRFVLYASGGAAAKAGAEIQKFAAEHGMIVTVP